MPVVKLLEIALTMQFLSLLVWKHDATSVFTSEQHFQYGYGYVVLPVGMVFDICMWLFCLFKEIEVKHCRMW